MSVSNIASSLYQNNQSGHLTDRIRQRLSAYQEIAETLRAGHTEGTLTSVQQPLRHSPATGQTQAGIQSNVEADVTALREAIQSGNQTAAWIAAAQLQTDIKAALPENSQANVFATDLKTLRDAIQAGDQTAARAAFAQLLTDIQAHMKTYHQDQATILQRTASSGQENPDFNLNPLWNSNGAQNSHTAGAVNSGLQQLLKILASVNVSPLLGTGISGIASLIGRGINTSA